MAMLARHGGSAYSVGERVISHGGGVAKRRVLAWRLMQAKRRVGGVLRGVSLESAPAKAARWHAPPPYFPASTLAFASCNSSSVSTPCVFSRLSYAGASTKEEEVGGLPASLAVSRRGGAGGGATPAVEERLAADVARGGGGGAPTSGPGGGAPKRPKAGSTADAGTVVLDKSGVTPSPRGGAGGGATAAARGGGGGAPTTGPGGGGGAYLVRGGGGGTTRASCVGAHSVDVRSTATAADAFAARGGGGGTRRAGACCTASTAVATTSGGGVSAGARATAGAIPGPVNAAWNKRRPDSPIALGESR